MINKKYRPIKHGILAITIDLFSFLVIILSEGYDRVITIISSLICIFVTINFFISWFEIQEDKIIIYQPLCTFEKKYRSGFKIREIFLKDINYINFSSKEIKIAFILKDEPEIILKLNGFFKSKVIINLFHEINKKLLTNNYNKL